jgi:hypothetical protein
MPVPGAYGNVEAIDACVPATLDVVAVCASAADEELYSS